MSAAFFVRDGSKESLSTVCYRKARKFTLTGSIMDNVLKVLIGVLGLFALVILAIPSSGPDEENVVKPVATPTMAPQPNPPAPTPASGDEADEKSSRDEDWEDEYESFGQPMNDARPLGVNDDANSDAGQSNQANQGNAPGFPPAGAPAIQNGSAYQSGTAEGMNYEN